jgi:hypothetical protein
LFIVVGLVILVVAVVAAVAGVLTNSGHAHALPAHSFAVLGYHVTGSTGTLFLYGVVVGAVGVFGLSVLLAGARRTSRRGRAARHGLKQSQQETAAAAQARDDLIAQRDTARTYTANTLGSDGVTDQAPAVGHRGRSRPFSRRAAARQATDQPELPVGQPGAGDSPQVPAPAANTSHP